MEETLLGLLRTHGYLALVAVGFAEYAGLPVAGVPLLVVAGGLGAQVGLRPIPGVLAAAAGGLAADLGWYLLVRWRGDALVDAACGLTSNRSACVVEVGDRVGELGPAYIVPVKFVPGAANLVGAGAALAGTRPGSFVVLDGAALVLWAGVWTAAGRVLSSEVQAVLEVAGRYQRIVLVLAVALVAAAAAWRLVRVARHREAHAAGPEPDAPEG